MNTGIGIGRVSMALSGEAAVLEGKERLERLAKALPQLGLRFIDYYLYDKEWLEVGGELGRRPKESCIRQPARSICNSDYTLRFRKRCQYLLPFTSRGEVGDRVLGCSAFQCVKRQSCINYWGQFGVGAKVLVVMELDAMPHWVAVFTLYSRYQQPELQRRLGLPEVSNQLKACSEDLFRCHADEINPYINFSVIGAKSLKIIELLSKGETTKSISDSLFMTERGVMYHIDTLKDKIGAKNRVHLVSHLYRNRLIF